MSASRSLPSSLASFARGAPPGEATRTVATPAARPVREVPGPHNPTLTLRRVTRASVASATIPLFVDLHTHSTASDGTDAPAQLVRRAKAAGLTALALTDHDTCAGVAEAADEAKRVGLDFIPGIEISAAYPRPGVMHLLGYGVDPDHPTLVALCDRLQTARHERNLFLVDALNEVGIRVTYEELLDLAGRTGVVGRPHFAKLLYLKGYIPHVNAAYKYYLGNTGRFRFDRQEPEPGEAIAAVHAAGGVVSLAHPNQLQKQNFAQLRHEIQYLAHLGLDGVEVIYNDHRESFVAELKDLCRRHDLLMTGGSDFHGHAKKWIVLGRCGMRRRVPRKLYDRLLDRLAARRAA